MVERILKVEGNRISINTWVALLSFLLVIVTAITSIVSLTTSIQTQVQYNTKEIEELKNLNERIITNQDSTQNRISVIETHYEHITDQLNRIEQKLNK